jgi:hypothetical protein
MKRRGKLTLSCWAAGTAVVLSLMGNVAFSRQSPALGPAQIVIPSASITDLFATARPHLEAVLAAQLSTVPKFRAVSLDQQLTTPDDDLDAFLRWHFPSLEGHTLTRTRQIACQIVGKATVAQYDNRDDTIMVVLDNMREIAAWEPSLANVNSAAFLQLDLVHEAVRRHLDHRFHIAKLRQACLDAEEDDALQAAIEGQTQAVTHAVAARLGTEAVFPLLAARYLKVPDEAPDSSIEAVSQKALHARYSAAVHGMLFAEAVAATGTRDPAGLIFSRLPRQMTVIGQPQRWLQACEKKEADLAAVLKPLENALPAAQWQPGQQTWTPSMFTQAATLLGAPPEQAEKIGKTWYEGRSLVWSGRSHPEYQVALSVARHITDAGARAHFGFAIDLARQQETKSPNTCGPALRVIESKSAAVRTAGFDEAVRNDKVISFGGGDPMPVSQLLARCGNTVIEYTCYGQRGDPALAERLLQEVRKSTPR